MIIVSGFENAWPMMNATEGSRSRPRKASSVDFWFQQIRVR